MKKQANLIALALLVAISSSASAAYIANYNTNDDVGGPLAAHDWVDHLTVSDLGPTGGPVRSGGAGVLSFKNWGTTLNSSSYIGFSVTADTGYQLNITDFQYNTNARKASVIIPVTLGVSAFQWAYRVDANNDGTFEQDWTYGVLHTPETDPNYSKSDLKTWDFPDISTTGTVEFGLFAQGPDTTKDVTVFSGPLNLNGTVTPVAVPEASSALLGLVGALTLLRRRR